MKKILIIICLVLLTVFYHLNNKVSINNQKIFDQIDLNQFSKIMIVAHPDDETLWGGMHLIEDKYLVICLTNQSNKTRALEFKNVLSQTKSSGIILDYPDKTNGKRDNWFKCYQNIQADLTYLLTKQSFDTIVTHNPDGEYGHIHHQKTSNIVTTIAKKLNCTNNLFYFGKYYKKNDSRLPQQVNINEDLLSQKTQLLTIYTSQNKVCQKFKHMNAHENWISYHNWS